MLEAIRRLEQRRSWASLASWWASLEFWAASFLGVFGGINLGVFGVFIVLGDVCLGRLWLRRSWPLWPLVCCASWTWASCVLVLGVFGVLGCVGLVRLSRLVWRLSWSSLMSPVFGVLGDCRLGRRRSRTSLLCIFVLGGIGPVRFWRLVGVVLWRLEQRRSWWASLMYWSVSLLGGVDLGRRLSWTSLASWVASVLFVFGVLGSFGVLGGVGLGRLWRHERRLCCTSLWALVLGDVGVLGGVVLGRLWSFGRHRSGASVYRASWVATVFGVFVALAASVLGVFVVLAGVRLRVLWRLERRRSWVSLGSWATSVFGVFGVLDGVCLGRLCLLERRGSWASVRVSWAASLLGAFGVFFCSHTLMTQEQLVDSKGF
jgi:hypothetical protein